MASLRDQSRALAPNRLITFGRGTVPFLIGVAIALVMQFYVTDRVGPFYSKLLLDIGINIVLAVSLNIVNGFTGQFSIGHAGFMAVGGYTAGAITSYGSYKLWGGPGVHGGFLGSGELLFVVATLAGGLVAAMFG